MAYLVLALGSLALFAWTVFQIGGARVSGAVTDIAGMVGPLLTLTLLPAAWRRRRDPQVARVAACFAGAVLCWVIGSAYWVYEDLILGHVNYPSWADVAWLAAYPCFFAGVCLLPRRSSPREERARALLDGLMVVTTAAAFSWFFELGPTVLQGDANVLAAVVNAAYPIADVVLAVALVLLAQGTHPGVRRTVLVIGTALVLIVAADSIYLYKVLDGSYVSGTPLDVLWFTAFGLLGLAARDLLTTQVGEGAIPAVQAGRRWGDSRRAVGLVGNGVGRADRWNAFAPYVLVPCHAALVIWAWGSEVDGALKWGVYVSAALLLFIIIARQILVILQNHKLLTQLGLARADVAAALEETRVAAQRFELAADATGDAVWDLDVASGAVWWNSAPSRLFGYAADEPCESLDWWEERVHPDDRERVVAGFETMLAGDAQSWTSDYRFRRADGGYASVLDRCSIIRDDAGRAIRVVGVLLDLTPHKEAQRSLMEMNGRLRHALDEVSERERVIAQQAEQLRASQEQLVAQERLRALGTMAAGIAHDLNNALAPVAGFAELLWTVPTVLDDRTKTRSYLQLIHTGAQDAASVVRRLREFYRPREAEDSFQPLALHELAASAVALTRPTWKDQALTQGRQIDVEADLPEVPLVLGDDAALREALTNLIFNAVDAMPAGGTLGVSVSREGETACLTVSDTGTGMPEDVRRRCLEPFFTTKGERGSGLGLAMVHGIAERHSATLRVDSAPGAGTRITLCLPLMTEAALVGGGAGPTATVPGEALRVLVVDDEPAVRATIAALLESDGHHVASADGATTALDHLARHPADIVFTDRAMPGVPGERLALMVKQRYPAIPVVMVTGYGDLMNASGEHPESIDAVIAKPVTRESLRRVVSAARG